MIKCQRLSKVLLIITFVLTFNTIAIAADEQLILAIDNRVNIISIDNVTMNEFVLYGIKEPYYIVNISVAPNDDKFALLMTEKAPCIEHIDYREYKKLFKRTLIVNDAKGKIIKEFYEDVRQYTWSPKGDKIACIVGHWSEDADYGFIPEGIFIYNFSNNDKKLLNLTALDIFWSEKDNNIYIYNNDRVYIVDNKTNKLIDTEYKDIFFSPNGKYYIFRGNVENEFRKEIYSAEDNENVTSKLWNTLNKVVDTNNKNAKISIKEWIRNGKSELIIEYITYEYTKIVNPTNNPTIMGRMRNKEISRTMYIYDVDSDNIKASFNDIDVRWTSSGKIIVRSGENGKKMITSINR